jgi:NAD(P)-dependent dehydrogenase (short-subunit alcohol dehydrogenase family)
VGAPLAPGQVPSLDLTGRTVLITGAARGIGRACAELLATCGAGVAICDVRGDELAVVQTGIGKLGADVLAAEVDVREAAPTESFVAAVGERFGGVDILVNNAGGSFHASLADVSPKGEAMLVAENFTSVTRLVRLVAPLMPAGSSIVNVTSIEAHQAAPGFAIYAAMKAAVANLTASLALELAARGIRVNAIAPDAIGTAGDDDARTQMLADDARFDPMLLPPLGRRGSPDEAARVVLFLASELSAFVTGTTIHVDGGARAAGGWRLIAGGP